jgi:hypothetical protein
MESRYKQERTRLRTLGRSLYLLTETTDDRNIESRHPLWRACFDATGGIARPLATMLVADFGAEVRRVDDGDRWPGTVRWHRRTTIVSVGAVARSLAADGGPSSSRPMTQRKSVGPTADGLNRTGRHVCSIPWWQPSRGGEWTDSDAMTADGWSKLTSGWRAGRSRSVVARSSASTRSQLSPGCVGRDSGYCGVDRGVPHRLGSTCRDRLCARCDRGGDDNHVRGSRRSRRSFRWAQTRDPAHISAATGSGCSSLRWESSSRMFRSHCCGTSRAAPRPAVPLRGVRGPYSRRRHRSCAQGYVARHTRRRI